MFGFNPNRKLLYYYIKTELKKMKKFLMLLVLAATLFACDSDDDEVIFIPQLAVESTEFELISGVEAQTLTIKSNTNWVAETSADWLVLSQSEGQGDASIELTFDPNRTSESRKATITIKAEGVAEAKTIEVDQRRQPETVGLYILSEGNWNANQAELAYYDVKSATLTKKYFAAQNGGAKLGDTGNDLAIYGSKMYCVVSGASVESGGGYIEVIDPKTGKSQKRIPFTDAEGEADLPRKVTFAGGKGYVTGHSGVVARLDTTSLEIDAKVKLSGTYSEGITQYRGNLYICNSGYGEGNTISVVDIATFNKESKVITVPQNPVKIQATTTGDIYFTTSTLEWSTGAPSNLHVLNAKTGNVAKTFDIRASALAIGKDYVYAVDNNTDWTTYETFDYNYKVDLKTYNASSFSNDIWDYFMVYNVDVNLYSGDVYILGQGQDVAIFGADGALKTKLKVGTGFGNKVVPVFKY